MYVLLLANTTQSSFNNIGSYHVDILRELVRRVLRTKFWRGASTWKINPLALEMDI